MPFYLLSSKRSGPLRRTVKGADGKPRRDAGGVALPPLEFPKGEPVELLDADAIAAIADDLAAGTLVEVEPPVTVVAPVLAAAAAGGETAAEVDGPELPKPVDGGIKPVLPKAPAAKLEGKGGKGKGGK